MRSDPRDGSRLTTWDHDGDHVRASHGGEGLLFCLRYYHIALGLASTAPTVFQIRPVYVLGDRSQLYHSLVTLVAKSSKRRLVDSRDCSAGTAAASKTKWNEHMVIVTAILIYC